MSPRFLPTASLETLKRKSQLIAWLREFFRANGYWECETPILSREVIVDANLDPFVTHDVTGSPYYLQTSPEAGMKRLLSAGADAIFQITRAMRRGETGRLHNPEFTMVEWYRVGDDHHDQMDFVERLVRAFYEEAGRQSIARCSDDSSRELSTTPFERLTYDAAFERYSGTRVSHLSSDELGKLASDHGVATPPAMSTQGRDGWLNLLLAELVEPHLGLNVPQFVYDYPASQAALSKTHGDPLHPENSESLSTGSFEVAERFELYDRGVELCNGYHELTDADEFVRRSLVERERLESEAEVWELPGAPLLEGAMRRGIPNCAGVALGLDRLVMLALGMNGVSDVIAFPGERA